MAAWFRHGVVRGRWNRGEVCADCGVWGDGVYDWKIWSGNVAVAWEVDGVCLSHLHFVYFRCAWAGRATAWIQSFENAAIYSGRIAHRAGNVVLGIGVAGDDGKNTARRMLALDRRNRFASGVFV